MVVGKAYRAGEAACRPSPSIEGTSNGCIWSLKVELFWLARLAYRIPIHQPDTPPAGTFRPPDTMTIRPQCLVGEPLSNLTVSLPNAQPGPIVAAQLETVSLCSIR